MKAKTTYLLLFIILLLGLLLRIHNYAVWPREGATFDEHAWTWLGLSILETGVPTTWSPHKQYTHKIPFQNEKGASFVLVTPYLEHPPLFGLVAGSFAKLMNVSYLGNIHLERMRILPLILGLLSIASVYMVTESVSGEKEALLASFIYAIIPTVVVGSRIVQNENFFIPLFLFSLYLLSSYIKLNKKRYFFLGCIIISMLPLAKMPWIAAPFAGIVFLISKKKYTDSLLVLLSTSVSLLIYLLWGFLWDAQVFGRLWQLQLARYDITFDGIFSILLDPIATDRFLLDGWILAGWGSILLLSFIDIKKYSLLIFGFLSYLGVYLVAIPNEPGHGWYRYPFYPFLAIGLGILLKKYFFKQPLGSFFFLLIIGLSMLSQSWQKQLGFSFAIYRGFIIFCAFSLIEIVLPYAKTVKFGNITRSMLFIIACSLTIWTTLLYSEQ